MILDNITSIEKELALIKLKSSCIDYILQYQTSENYSFDYLWNLNIDHLYEIKKEIG